ncbi:MAG: tRNA epoxyqueuosine(34) reductase QueG [Bacillota bacterium]|nr:tRNA epoxyqueuosine(34) reductase QueG [Bacillota bacterium]
MIRPVPGDIIPPGSPRLNAGELRKRRLRREARRLGLPRLGVAEAAAWPEAQRRLRLLRRRGIDVPFTRGEPEERSDPAALLPGARSLLVAALPYGPAAGPSPAGPAAGEPATPSAQCATGRIARYAAAEDYHPLLRRRLEALGRWLEAEVPGARWRASVDGGLLSERAAAVAAGLGWVGRNGCLITPEFGSWLVLGVLVTDVELPPDPPATGGCGRCRRCLEACPTRALLGDGLLRPDRCLSTWTQRAAPLPPELRAPLGDRLWGCDTCQEVCPYNLRLRKAGHPRGEPWPARPERLPLAEVAAMGHGAFRRLFGRTPAAWRGPRPLRRNALLALGNLPRSAWGAREEAALRRGLASPDPLLREAAAWAQERRSSPLGVVVGSLNPSKVEAAREVFERLCPGARVEGIAVPSGVRPQPLGEEETLRGAMGRARAALEAAPWADLGVGMEGGVDLAGDGAWLINWCVVAGRDGSVSRARGLTMPLPERFLEPLRAGRTLGELMARESGDAEINSHEGAVGWFTRGLVDRRHLWRDTLAAALARRVDRAAGGGDGGHPGSAL